MPRRVLGPKALQLYFVVGLLALAGAWFFFSQFLLIRLSRQWTGYAEAFARQIERTMTGQLEEATQLKARIYEKFMRRAAEVSGSGSPELDIIFDEVIQKLDFPVVICDARGEVVATANLEGQDTSRAGLAGLLAEMDAEHPPIEVTVPEGDTVRVLNVIHYGVSAPTRALRSMCSSLEGSVRYLRSSVQSLRVFSLLQLLLPVGFVAVGVWGILAYKQREQEHIWTALAKETAHQLATPISSLSAWLELVRQGRGTEVAVEMEQDLTRMREVLDRFSRIGLPPELGQHRVGELVRRSVEFVRRRTARSVRFEVEIVDDPMVQVDNVLFSWTLENLLKNAVDAIGAREGVVAVRVQLWGDRRFLAIDITDTGEGMRTERPFDPGVSTKPHGWGVGLTLAKRIVEGYHQGKLILRESRPGRTVFTILLPLPAKPTQEPTVAV
ncbi:MAG: HAMP domain-containing sensor histidine kinase [candidate division WOR-3 bacterium]